MPIKSFSSLSSFFIKVAEIASLIMLGAGLFIAFVKFVKFIWVSA